MRICYVKALVGRWAIGRLEGDEMQFQWWTEAGWRSPGPEFDAEPNADIIKFKTIASARKLARFYGWEE